MALPPCRILLNSSEVTSAGVDSSTGWLPSCRLLPSLWREEKVLKGRFSVQTVSS